MERSSTRLFSPGRIVALILIAALVGGLTAVRLRPTASSVSVPPGARGGTLVLERCGYATENGTYPADCGTLVVPENRADPHARLIALPVTRIHARGHDPARPAEPIFRLEGGPGLTNMTFPDASRFADDHDVVLVGYRGVDGSSKLDCPEVSSALKHSADLLGEKSMRAYTEAYRTCADRLTHRGVDLAGYSLPERVDDLEAARRALGYGRVDLLSESAGTRTAMIYSWRYPNSIHRSVMVGANPPGHFLWDARTTDEQIGDYAALCAKDASCRKRTDDLVASMKRTASDLPDRWWFLPIKRGNVRVASFYGLMHAGSEAAPVSAPMTIGSWLAGAKGNASGFWFMSLMADVMLPDSFVWGDMAATSRSDAQAAKSYFAASGQRDSILGEAASGFLWADGRTADAWPASPDEDQYSSMRPSNVETLVVSGALDFATPPQVATEELMPYLPNGHQVVLAGFGHTADFWTQQKEAGSRLVNTFFETGVVDDSSYEPMTVDFTPVISQEALAEIVAGAMIGLGLVTVLSLALMGRRVHKRGHFGRKAGVALRSGFPVVLGLGGWCVGALIVLTTRWALPLDDELLAVLSVGVPVGLGIYWAWVHRAWPAQDKRIGLTAAAGGGLVGAWLGFHATPGLLALLTAIAGAIAGANLMLILFDMSRVGSDGEQASTRTAVPASEPKLEPLATTS
jgi:pimeloyl-ACP methyl ester carboxylesterase